MARAVVGARTVGARRRPPVGLVALAALVFAACREHVTLPLANPCRSGGDVSLDALRGTIVDCSAGASARLAGGGASYLIVPQLAASGVANRPVSYVLGVPSGAAAVVASAAVAPAYVVSSSVAPASLAGAPAVGEAMTRLWAGRWPNRRQAAFDAALRAAARSALASGRWRAGAAAPRGSPSAVASGAPPEEGSLRDFRVLSSFDAQHPTFATVTARLAYAGTNILVYLDTLAPPAGFSSSQLQAFARLLDQTLYPLDLSTFGPPSDIDQNGRVVVLLSPVVNALTPTAECSGGFVAGFFMGTDLGSTNDANSNHGEIFYSLVPDPSGSVGCAVSTGDVLRIAPPVFLHELQHLISFSQHVVAHGGQPEDGWLDEGLSRVAEELGSRYYEARFPPPTGRAAPGQIVPDSALPFLLPLLLDSYRYLERTDTVTLTLHSDSDFGLAWRGGVWLLMRWLGDQKGDAAFYKRLEQTKLTGIANIEAAAGERFPVLFGDFSTALWTDSLPGVARSAVPARNRFVSRNLRQLYDALYRTVGFGYGVSSPSPIELTALPASGPLAGSMVPGTAAFYQFDTPAGARTVTLQFTAPGGVPLAAKLHPQLSIFRLQ